MNPDATKWISVLISAVSLILSGAAFYLSLSRSQVDDFKLALNTVTEFVEEGKALPGTPACFEYLYGLSDRKIRDLFSRGVLQRTLEGQDGENFQNCVQKAGLTGVDKESIEKILRKRIILKLNSYEKAFLPVFYDAGMHEPICSTVWPSFDEYADSFLVRISNMNPKPYLFSSDTELSAARHFAEKGECAP